MIAALALRGLGPHADTALTADPKGWTTVSGPSESGKSFTLDAVCFALWGTDRTGDTMSQAAIRDGEQAADVELRLASGTVVRRRMTRAKDRGWRRSLSLRDGRDLDGLTEDVFRAQLGPLADEVLCRTIMAPLAWVALLSGPGGGRPLRDLLERALPGPSASALLDGALQPGEPRDPKAAEAARRDARKARDEAAGRRGEADRALAALLAASLPTSLVADVERARAEVAAWASASAALTGAREALVAWKAKVAAHEASARAAEAWDARATAIVAPEAKPLPDDEAAGLRAEVHGLKGATQKRAEAVEAARAKLAPVPPALLAEVARCEAAVQDAERRVEDAVRRAKLLETVPCKGRILHPGPTKPHLYDSSEIHCGSCSLLTDAREAASSVARLEDAANAANAALVRARKAVEDANLAALKAKTAYDKAVADHAAAAEKLATVQAKLDAHVAAEKAHAVHRDALAALGDRPEVVPHPGEAPTVEEVPEPVRARRFLEDVARWEAEAAAHARQVEAASKRLADAEKAHADAEAKAARADEVVEIVRAAPGRALAGKLAALGSGPLSVVVPEDGDAVQVLIDGRPWALASTGRRIVADLDFRARLRAVATSGTMRLGWLPLFVDEVQSVGGQALPDVAGPVVALRTTDGGELVVTAGVPVREAA